VEGGVLVVERWILARLRNRTFFSLDELNQAITDLLEYLNNRPMQKLKRSRKEQFERLDRPALKPLPLIPFPYAEWKTAKVNVDYHIELDGHYYSVPYQLAGTRLEVRFSARTVECFHKGKRVASHKRSFKKGHHTTTPEHMPRGHREYLKWTPERLLNWAAKTGPACEGLAKAIMNSRAHPQQGFRSVLGIMSLKKTYGDERLEAACQKALDIKAKSYSSLKSILKNNLDKKTAKQSSQPLLPIDHHNIRGKNYYAPKQGDVSYADQPNHGQADRHALDRNGQGSNRADGNAGS
jgi:transposase